MDMGHGKRTEFCSQQIVFYQTFFTVWLFILKFSDGFLFVAAKIRAKIFSLKFKADPHTTDKTIFDPFIYTSTSSQKCNIKDEWYVCMLSSTS
jgi:hypothetical protein